MHVELRFIPSDSCVLKSQSMYVCATDNDEVLGTQNACMGDSGGPLYDEDNQVLVGVTSFGYPDCVSGPSTFAKVASSVSDAIAKFILSSLLFFHRKIFLISINIMIIPKWNFIKSTICSNHADPRPTFCDPCNDNQLDLSISVGTDNFPEDNKWTVQSSDGASFESDPFDARSTYNSEYCLDKNLCHSFEMVDTTGDGMLLFNGFNVFVDNVEVLGDFNRATPFDKLSVEFGQCNNNSPSYSPVISLHPSDATSTDLPSLSPIAATDHPTTSVECLDSPFQFRVKRRNKKKFVTCAWVSQKLKKRCQITKISTMCPNTCNTCDVCVDGAKRFKFEFVWNGQIIKETCKGVASNKSLCEVEGMIET